MDSLSSYVPGTYKKHVSWTDLQHMKKAMKKVPVLQLQSDIYHKKEVEEAESLLGEFPKEESQMFSQNKTYLTS